MTTADDHLDRIRRHYGVRGLNARILARLEECGLRLDALGRDDLADFDEFHAGGRDATRALARAAGLRPGLAVLDIGCGLGGPARTLAAEFACRVVGIDATADYIEAARMLTDLTRLGGRVRFAVASAPDLPFPAAAFDVVWLQFVTPNIPDKDALLAEVRRLLAPGGRLAIHDVMRGSGEPLALPVFWAEDDSLNALDSPEDFARRCKRAGLARLDFRDASPAALAWFRAALAPARPPGPKRLGLGLIVPGDARTKSANVLANLESGRIRIFLGIFSRDAKSPATAGGAA